MNARHISRTLGGKNEKIFSLRTLRENLKSRDLTTRDSGRRKAVREVPPKPRRAFSAFSASFCSQHAERPRFLGVLR